MLGLKPWEYYRLTIADFNDLIEASEYRIQIDWDRFRWLGTVVAQSAGAKKIRKPADLMKLPLIDGEADAGAKARMIEFLKQQRNGG